MGPQSPSDVKKKQPASSTCSLGTPVTVLAFIAVGALALALRQTRIENFELQARVVALGEGPAIADHVGRP